MRIYMIMTVLAPLGGIESALLPLAKELQQQGHEVVVWTIRPISRPNQNATVLENAGIQLHTVSPTLYQILRRVQPHWLRLLQIVTTLALLPLLAIIGLDAIRQRRSFAASWRGARGRLFGKLSSHFYFERFYYWHLRRLLRPASVEQVAHLHGWGCGEDPPNAARWLRERNIATAYTEHNSPDPKIHPQIDAAPMNVTDVLIAVSHAGKRGLEQVGQATPPIEVIPYSVAGLPAASRGKSAEQPFTILCFARLHPQKGQADLISAMPTILGHVPQAKLWLAGAGELRESLEAQVAACRLIDSVEFLGLVTHDELPDLLVQADVVVLPSYWEGLPVSLIESLSAGKACIVTNVGGNPELIRDGENGFVVPPHDVNALANAIVTLANDAALRERFEQASYARFASGEFSPATVTAKTLTAYRKAIEGDR